MGIHPAGDRPKHSIFFWVVVLVGLTEAVLSVPALTQTTGRPSSSPSLPPAYLEAIDDARFAEPQEIYQNLTPIVWYNPRLSWDRSRVLVTVWTTYSGYASRVGRLMRLPVDVWVTAAPDLQNFCQTYHPTDDISLSYRLNQLLGLPPDAAEQSRWVVELWVEPRYLFRPSPDPDITDQAAALEFPVNPFESLSDLYQGWFTSQFSSRYPATGTAYPWTQLGYTYDWGNSADWQPLDPDRPVNVGLSEFVIRQGALATVHSTQSAETYCQ